jgi:TRAP-type C4-dicarboxylate transport system permease small subunit
MTSKLSINILCAILCAIVLVLAFNTTRDLGKTYSNISALNVKYKVMVILIALLPILFVRNNATIPYNKPRKEKSGYLHNFHIFSFVKKMYAILVCVLLICAAFALLHFANYYFEVYVEKSSIIVDRTIHAVGMFGFIGFMLYIGFKI